MKFLFIVLLGVMAPMFLHGQESLFKMPTVDDHEIKLNTVFTNVQILRFNAPQLDRYLSSKRSTTEIFNLEIGKNINWSFYIEEVEIITPETKFSIIDSDGRHGIDEIPAVKTYKGVFTDGREGQIRLTVNGDFLSAYILDEGKNFFIEPMSYYVSSDDSARFVFYNSEDLTPKHTSRACFRPPTSFDNSSDVSRPQLRTGDCFKLKLAVMSDYWMYIDPAHPGIEGVVNHIVAVMNNVESNYEYNGNQNFDNGINFEISEWVISTCAPCDPISDSANAIFLLNEFSDWVDAGNFYHDFHAAHFWTDRVFSGNFGGLAFQSSNLFCSSNAKAVFRDFSTNAALLKTLVAHEIGHNFNGVHDVNSGFILSPTVTVTDTWSMASQNAINTQINTQSFCMRSCTNRGCGRVENAEITGITTNDFTLTWTHTPQQSYTIKVRNWGEETFILDITTTHNSVSLTPPGYEICKKYDVFIYNTCSGGELSAVQRLIIQSPVVQGCADFSVPKTVSWPEVPVRFTDLSLNATSWSWTFGNGQSSTLQNPSVIYTTPGFYDVSLTVNHGAHSTTKTSIVKILPSLSPPYTLVDGGNFESHSEHFASEAIEGSVNVWEYGNSSLGLATQGNAWKSGLDTSIPQVTSKSALYSPQFDFTSYENFVLHVDVGMQTLFCNAPVAGQLQYSTNEGLTWTRLGGAPGFYNAGPQQSCEVASQVFTDGVGWTHNQNYVPKQIDVSFLAGQQSVIFRFVVSISGIFNGGYNVDGILIDNFRLDASQPVPLNLVENSLTVSKRDNSSYLQWQTTATKEFLYFEVLHSVEGLYWESMGAIDYALSHQNRHEFIHTEPAQGQNYYKIQAIDIDGVRTYSNVAQIYWGDLRNVSVCPNPIRSGEVFHLYFSIPEDVKAVNLISPMGRVIPLVWENEWTAILPHPMIGVCALQVIYKDHSYETLRLVVVD